MCTPADNFYSTITSFESFAEITNEANYQKVPDDWFVFIADIKGSTKAIESGRYRDVNMIGAACIASALNAVNSFDLPFVFGGDGATILCPESLKQTLMIALAGVQKRSKAHFDLELRVGCVSVNVLNQMNCEVLVAKHKIADKVNLAMFRGQGLTAAEQLIKSEDPKAELLSSHDFVAEPQLDGLSCRWSAFKSTYGHVLSLIVKTKPQVDQPQQIYAQVLEKIESILQNSIDHHSPITNHKLERFGYSSAGMKAELNIATSKQDRWKRWPRVFLGGLVSKFVIYFNIWFGPFVAKRYKSEIIRRCDHKKFDETLRMILDCDETHKIEIENYLQNLHEKNLIDFGVHVSDSALMTCYVPGPTNGTHIHFIDGNDGGYALAAKSMKARMKKI